MSTPPTFLCEYGTLYSNVIRNYTVSRTSAPRAWNRLPTNLKMLRSTDSFRRKLKLSLSLCSDPRERADLFCDAPSVYQYGGAI